MQISQTSLAMLCFWTTFFPSSEQSALRGTMGRIAFEITNAEAVSARWQDVQTKATLAKFATPIAIAFLTIAATHSNALTSPMDHDVYVIAIAIPIGASWAEEESVRPGKARDTLATKIRTACPTIAAFSFAENLGPFLGGD